MQALRRALTGYRTLGHFWEVHGLSCIVSGKGASGQSSLVSLFVMAEPFQVQGTFSFAFINICRTCVTQDQLKVGLGAAYAPRTLRIVIVRLLPALLTNFIYSGISSSFIFF